MGAAAELERRFAAQGPAAEGSYRVPPDPDMDPTPGSGPPSHRKSSLEMPQRMAELRGNIMSSLSLNRHRDRDGGGGEGRSKGNSPSPPRSPRGTGGGGFGGAGGLMRTLSGGLRHKMGDGGGGDGGGFPSAARVSPRIPAIPSPTPSFRDADAEDEQPGLPVSTSAPGNGKASHFGGDQPLVDVSAAASAAAAARDKAAREARHAGRLLRRAGELLSLQRLQRRGRLAGAERRGGVTCVLSHVNWTHPLRPFTAACRRRWRACRTCHLLCPPG